MEKKTDSFISRRDAVKRTLLGAGAFAVAGTGYSSKAFAEGVRSKAADSLLPYGATTLQELTEKLARAPRHRNFSTVPMILTSPEQWDSEALDDILHYMPTTKQVWDNTALTSPWLNGMRNAMNCQIWSFKHPDFLVLSATHGSAHMALYDDYIWNKYLSVKTKGKWTRNIWIQKPPASAVDPDDYNAPRGVDSPYDNSIAILQRRGVIFLACHNEVWELTMGLHAAGINPDHLAHPEMAAEFTNHLIAGVVLTPGIVGTIPQLEQAGYCYVK